MKNYSKCFAVAIITLVTFCFSLYGVWALSIQDVTNIQRHIAGFTVESFDENLADYNKDGVINIRDVTSIQKELAKVTDTIPKETEDIGDIF